MSCLFPSGGQSIAAHTPVRMVNTRTQTTPHTGEDAEQRDPSPPGKGPLPTLEGTLPTAGRDAAVQPLEKLMFSTKLNTLAYNPTITLLGIYPKELKN